MQTIVEIPKTEEQIRSVWGMSLKPTKPNVLDKIRAEIEQLRIHKAEYLTNDNKVCIDSQDVLDIIDKYRKGERE